MRVLVVDDDASTRRILQRLLSHFSADVALAADGVEALASIQADPPDLVLLDVMMPLMDGVTTLAAIRASPDHADLPVVSISAVSEREMVLRMVNLGIADYLLKPLNLETAHKRLTRILASLPPERRRAPVAVAPCPPPDRRPRLLLADPDPDFRAFAAPLLEPHFAAELVASGSEAIRCHLREAADVVCVAERLPLLSEELLATVIRQQAGPGGGIAPQIFLLTATGAVPPDAAALFDGAIRRSTVPEVFLRSFHEVVSSGCPTLARITPQLRRTLEDELLAGARQTIGLLTSEEVVALDPAERTSVTRELVVSVELRVVEGGRVRVAAIGTRADMERVAGRIVGRAAGAGESPEDAFAELVGTVAGRLRAAFETRGFRFETEGRRVEPPAGPDPAGALCTIGVRTDSGERLLLELTVEPPSDEVPAAAA